MTSSSFFSYSSAGERDHNSLHREVPPIGGANSSEWTASLFGQPISPTPLVTQPSLTTFVKPSLSGPGQVDQSLGLIT